MAVTTWHTDPTHTDVQFSAKHMMVTTVRGKFTEVEGTLMLDEDRPEASFGSFTVQAASLESGVEKRDGHLRSADFFDAETYPAITFKSTRVEDVDDDGFRLVGNLTIHGVTREVVLDVTSEGRGKDPWGGERAGYSAKTKINRSDYGLRWNQALETGGVLVGDEVKINIDLELIKAA
jgi:polyisoprenoid-binding protein YceI